MTVRGRGAGRVGRVLVVTDRAQVPPGRDLLDVVAAALDGGADGILVRERHLPDAQRARLVEATAVLCAEAGALLVVAAPLLGPSGMHGAPRSPRPIQGAGVHLRSVDVDVDLVSAAVVGRSCHGVADLVRAADDGLDYVTLSPVAASASKPGYGPALGYEGLRTTLATARRVRRTLPAVLALGGVEPHDAGRWVGAGADGVAVMGAVMRASDPRATTRALVAAVDAALARRPPRDSKAPAT
ncbi:thiamine phosphate synthase [Terrabacter sp. MAHUQ-38]|uniref:thiamine phosphate synthase n=1 Tax=unclassified Terrabacter TaxID=2630222 RepID=UPI00165E1CAE|nr:thiamine phosphate synthase [Terrabacter sp. MAHUQ-38]MBC9823003.1 thiamine phosphate synthase [Terrabacter sp. MAHUQ-38]